MAVNIIPPGSNRPIILEDASMHELFRDWSRFITDEVNNRSLLFGTGSPEGVVEAVKGREYMDESGTASTIKYIKQVDDVAGNNKNGWILV